MGSVRTYYDSYWENPDEAAPSHDPVRPARLTLLHKILNGTVERMLEVGCGHGCNVDGLRPHARLITAVDVASKPLDLAAKAYPECSFLQTGGGALPFRDGSFDAVVSFEVIEHVLDVDLWVAEISRVLKPGGVFVLSTPYHGTLKNLALALHGFERHYAPNGPHIRFFTVRSLRKTLENHGLAWRRLWKLGRFWPLEMDMMVDCRKKQ